MSPTPRFLNKHSLHLFLLTAFFITLVTAGYSQTDLYSRATGNLNTANTWATGSHGGTTFTGTVGPTHILHIGNGHTVTLPQSTSITVKGIEVHDTGASGTLLIGGNAGGAGLTVAGNITIRSSGTVRTTGDGSSTNTLTIGGNLANDNVFNMQGTVTSDVTNVIFNNTAAATISGSGTPNFNNLTMSTGSAANVMVNQNITVNGVLNFTADGLLVVGATSNITMARGATFGTVGSATRFVQLDGGTSASGSLIKTSNNTTGAWATTYPIGTATSSTPKYTPMVVSTVTNAPADNATLTVKPIYNSSIQGQLRRVFRLTVANNSVTTTTFDADFYYITSEDVSAGDALNNYTNIWYLNSGGGNWTSIGGQAPPSTLNFFSPTAAQTLANGTYYFTLGTATAYPNTWYSYQTGNWSNWENWTLDPSGTTLVNGLNLPPLPGDEIVILNGFTITNDVSAQVVSSTTIEGGATLDMAATTGNTLGVVSGSGILRMKGINLPAGTYTNFVAAGSGGTVEYYDIGGTLPVGQTTYNKLLLSNSTGSAIVYTMGSTLATLTLNSDFNITQNGGGGTVTWQINDASATQRTVSIAGDLTVSSGGQIRVGTGNEASANQHNVTCYGNLTNNGSIKFFDNTDTEFSDANYTSGSVYTNARQGNAATVTMSGVNNKVITTNGLTDFYRLIVNKGTGQQAMVTINSSDVANFRLFGTANLYSSGTQPNVVSDCALSIVNGTLQLLGKINIPTLIVNGSAGAPTDVFSIPQNGALWLNSANVTVTVTNNTTTNDDQRLQVNGLLRVTAGTLSCGYSRGIGSYSGGVVFVEGGTVNMWQYRPVAGGSNVFVYRQTGGTVNVGTKGYNGTPTLTGVIDNITEQFARFSLPTSTSSFQMSGNAILNIGSPSLNSVTAGAQGIDIQSAASNYNVTGGTVNFYIPPSGTDNYDFGINSTSPFYNVNIYKTSATGTLSAILAQPLTVLNNLSLVTSNNPVLNCNSKNLTIGGSFDIQSNTTANLGTIATPSGTNTLTFNGAGTHTWTLNGSISNLSTVILDKTGTLTLGGSGTFPSVTVGLTLNNGTLADGGKVVTVTGALTNGATHSSTGAGSITYSNTAASTINGSGGTFGNLTITTDATIATAGSQTITGNLRLMNANTQLSIASYSLKVFGGIFTDGTTGVAFSSTRRIFTRGLPNDDGLTRQAASGIDLLFPVGTGTGASAIYTPATINATATTAGLISVNPVAGTHPNVTTANQTVRYYWKVLSSGFVGLGAVTHKSYTYGSTLKDGTTTTYRPARYDQTTFKWAYGAQYNATTIPGTTTIPDFNTGSAWTGIATSMLDGEYTAGNQVAFGAVTVYYSSATPGIWSAAASWSTTAVGAAGGDGPPCSACPVVIGDGVVSHTITNDADAQSCGSLQINTNSVLDCNTRASLNFGVNNRGAVSGRGKIRISSGVFPSGDFTDFIGPVGGTVEWYGAMTTIPIQGPTPQNISLNTYYNLIVNPSSGSTMTLPNLSSTNRNMIVYNDFTTSGAGTINTAGTVGRMISVGGNFSVTGGSTFALQNAVSTTFSITGNTTIGSGSTLKVADAGGTRTHLFNTSGDFVNNGTVLFRGGSELVNMTFNGATDNVFTTNGTTTLNLLVVDKGTSQAPTLTVNGSGTIYALNNAWLTLSDGTLHFNFAGTAGTTTAPATGATTPGTFTLSTATTAFNIGVTSKLKISSGVLNVVTANNSGADLTLAGGLEVAGGTMNIGAVANTTVNNDIEYAAAGLPSITVSGGTLNVYGSIRRATATLSGALVYNQSGGTVTVAGTASNNTRGVFEIEDNAGSMFNLTGTALLKIQRTTGGTGFADLYVIPTSSTVSTTSTIEMGLATAAQAMSYNVSVPIGNFTIVNGGTNAQSVTMYSNPMIASGNILINANGTLNTNALDVLVGGNLTIDGTYNGAANTTTFNGSGAQTGKLSSTSSFLNMTVNKSSGTVSLSGTAPTLNNLNILNGTLDVGSMDLKVNRNITNNSLQIGGGKVSLAGSATTHTINSANGSFTNLTIASTGVGKTVVVNGNMKIEGTLDFPAPQATATTARYLKIGSNRLTFGVGGAVTNAWVNDFIRTNGVSSDLGVVKMWSTGTQTFTYAVGTRINYTPVEMKLNVTTAGSYTVIPVDDQHPTANAMGEQILNYYWIGIRDGSLAFSGTGYHSYQYPTAFIGGASGTFTPAHLDAINLLGWTTYLMPVPTNFASAGTGYSQKMTFTDIQAVSLPGVNGEFHYTAGTPGSNVDPNHTLPNPITPVYSRFSDNGDVNPTNVGNTTVAGGGNWNLATNWTLENDGKGAPLSVVPTGRPIVILPNAKINMNVTGLRAFKTTINGLLDVSNVVPATPVATAGHSLGPIDGTGTLRVRSSTLPAGNYANFVSATGGTIEYVATATTPLTMNNRSTYNNINVTGGTVTMTNTDLVLNGSVAIATGATLDNAANNRNMTVARNWTQTGTGAFTPGTGTVTFNSNANTVITGTNIEFYGLEVAKTGTATVSANNPVLVDGNLAMTSGIYVSTATNILTVAATGTSSGGSATSYVTGPMRKVLLAGTNFNFPSGSSTANRYRAVSLYNATADDTWTVQYVGNNPATDGYNNKSFNSGYVKKVSMFEYWLISRTGSAGSDVELAYSTGSYIANATNVGTVANLRVVHWNGTQWDEPLAGGTYSQTGDAVTGSVRANGVTNFSPFSLGSLDSDSPLPVKWGPVEATRVNGAVVVKWVTLQEENNDHFDIERSDDGISFASIGSVAGAGNTSMKQTYTFNDTQTSAARRYYYRIRQVDYNGVSDYSPLAVVNATGGVEAAEKSWIAYPNPLAKNVNFVLSRTDNVAPDKVHVTLYSAQGVLLYEGNGSLQEVNSQVNGYLQEAHSGVYVLQVSDGTLSKGFKIVRP